MSQAIFPALDGRGWNITRSPIFNSRRAVSVSGFELGTTYQVYPKYQFTLNYEVLRDSAAFPDYDTLLAFVLSRLGQFDSFLFKDWSDNTVQQMPFGTGDANTTQFQLTRSVAAGGFTFVEPVQNLNGIPQIYRNSWQGNQLLYTAQRTNRIIQSEQLNVTWSPSHVTVTPNAVVAPDGNTTGDLVVEDSATNTHSLIEATGFTPTLGSLNTFSIFGQETGSGAKRYLGLLVQGCFSSTPYAVFDLATGTVTATGAGATASVQTVPDMPGWWRCVLSCPATTVNAAASPRVDLSNVNSSAVPSYAGDGVSGLYLWGAQFESGQNATSYIPTITAAASTIDYAVDANGVVTLGIAPDDGDLMSWSGTFYYRCRFAKDQTDFNAMLQGLWNLQTISFIGAPGNKV